MKVIKLIFDFYINASIHVALAVCAFCGITALENDLKLDWNFFAFMFFATITGYNFVKYFGLAKFHHRSLATWLKTIQVFSFISFVGFCFFGIHLSKISMLFLVGLGLITFLYAIPFIPRKILVDQNKNLRSIGGLKVFVIAFVWSVSTVLLPMVESSHNLGLDSIPYTIQRFLLVFVLMFPFEIRDLQYDSLKLATIPQQIGVRSTKVLGVFLMCAYVILELITNNNSDAVVVNGMMSIALMIVLVYSNRTQHPYYSSFFVEGIPILWLGFLLFS